MASAWPRSLTEPSIDRQSELRKRPRRVKSQAKPDQFGPPPLDRAELPTEAKQLVDTQGDLDDVEKTIAYYW
ncbi:MAG TPA: hypothetical protein VHH34_25195, partial [Pseudonocardiaceae bacterium]|nr:hypothetical protein [Pseudonocardiaceae bacterium]